MTLPILHGFPQSSYVRSARLAFARRGIDYRLEPLEFGSEAHLALHPFAKVPALTDDGATIYETTALCRWAEGRGDGPTLFPTDAGTLVRAEQWASAVNAYLYDSLIRRYALVYIFQEGDRAKIDAVLPDVRRDLAVVGAAVADRPFLAGEAFTVGDALFGPILGTAVMFPEVQGIVEASADLGRYLGRLREEPGAEYLAPPPPAG